MGKKRYDQYRIAPDESGAADFRTVNQANRDKRRFARERSREKAEQPIEPQALEPTTEHAHEAELRRQEHIHEKSQHTVTE